MKKKLFLSLLVFTFPALAATTFPGSEPKTGDAYYLWNVGRQAFLCLDNSGLSLSGCPLPFTVGGEGATLTLTASEGELGSSLYALPTVGDSGAQHQWTAVGRTNGYVLSVRLPESADDHPIYYSEAFGDVRTMMQQPDDEFTDALWLFVSPSDAATAEVTLDETADSYTMPIILSTATVKLKRTFTLNSWNTLCVPFDITSQQLRDQFGDGVQLASLSGSNDTELIFALTDAVERGKPYIVKPSKEPSNGTYYVFTDVSAFADSPQAVDCGTAGFHGTFSKETVPAASYVFRNDQIYHLPEAMTAKGFRCWIQDASDKTGFTSWKLDGATEIPGIRLQDNAVVYDLSGRYRGNSTKGDIPARALPHGIYIIKGKKIIK